MDSYYYDLSPKKITKKIFKDQNIVSFRIKEESLAWQNPEKGKYPAPLVIAPIPSSTSRQWCGTTFLPCFSIVCLRDDLHSLSIAPNRWHHRISRSSPQNWPVFTPFSCSLHCSSPPWLHEGRWFLSPLLLVIQRKGFPKLFHDLPKLCNQPELTIPFLFFLLHLNFKNFAQIFPSASSSYPSSWTLRWSFSPPSFSSA